MNNYTSNDFYNYNENLIHNQSIDLNAKFDINLETINNSVDMLSQVKQVVEYNTNYVNNREINKNSTGGNSIGSPENDPVKGDGQNSINRNLSVISNFSHVSVVDNIKILNEFKNNIDDKIEGLKKKINLTKVKNEDENFKINYEKFRNINIEVFKNLLTFFDTNDILHLFVLNRENKNKILDLMKEYSKTIIDLFQIKYVRLLKVDSGVIIYKTVKKNKKSHLKISLGIKSKIIVNNIKDQTVNIGFKSKYASDKESLKNVFKFDVVDPSPLSFWIMREYTNVNLFNYYFLILKLSSYF